ncbi:MAG TPA: DUF484 domain-containing protein [Rhodospirillaceae bacterium]|nr:hypothetical protein [Rhodospirillaceae bacterium]HAA92941.1 DUF484 domain-containing protein [Rhodospirillaceae bacterium]HAT35387.1 DUF484 domain-containing protein [Rhodospirillaceae bacterium]
MSQDSTKAEKRPEVTAESVIEFLRTRPDFFSQHPEALKGLTLPNGNLGEGVVDFQGAVIDRLRTDAEEFKSEREDLLLTARANQQSLTRIHECVLAVLAARSFEQVIQTVTTDFAVMLDLDLVVLCIESTDDSPRLLNTRGLVMLPDGMVSRYFNGDQRLLLRGDVEGEPEIFGAGASLIRSDALVRLDISTATPPALIAFGSREPGRFDSGQSTELVGFLTLVLEHVIRAWLDVPH